MKLNDMPARNLASRGSVWPTTPDSHPATASLAVVGLGYVGLPLSLQFVRSGVGVLGLDIDPAKIEALNRGSSYIRHIPSEAILRARKRRQFSASTDFSRLREVEAVVICVPTPLNKNREPDISFVLDTGRAIAPFLRADGEGPTPSTPALGGGRLGSASARSPGRGNGRWKLNRPSDLPRARTNNHYPRKKLIVLESTSYPGTTDEDLRAVLEAGSGLKAGVDFHLAFSPEREDPGNPDSKVGAIPKVVGGYTPECLQRAVELYSKAIATVVPVSSCRVAEAAKLLENTFRSVNIALVNELKVVYDAMGIDIWEVIKAARTKPFGFMPFYPGPGLGGHCIPIDPFYLTWKAREYGQHTRFIELAGEINTSMPDYVIHRVGMALNARQKAPNGATILVLGLAYKPDVDDDRESPSYVLMDKLRALGATVVYYDPHVPVIRPSREHSHWAGTESVVWSREVIQSCDVVLIATPHRAVNYQELAEWCPCIVDARNAMAAVRTKPGQVWKA